MRKRFFYFIFFFLFASAALGQDSPVKTYSITFEGYKTKLSKQSKMILDEIAVAMKSQPQRCVQVLSNCTTEIEKRNIANWDRVNNAVNYLVEKRGIAVERLQFANGPVISDCSRLEFSFQTCISPSELPHPNLRKKTQ